MELKKGLTFEKSVTTGFMKNEMCKVHVTEHNYPRVIEMDYISSLGNNLIRYTITPKSNHSCQVTYKELKYDSNHVLKISADGKKNHI